MPPRARNARPAADAPRGVPFSLPERLPLGLELADVALLLLFLFLYLQSGDTEFLILLAALALGDTLSGGIGGFGGLFGR